MAQAATPKRVKKKIRKKASGIGLEQDVHKHNEAVTEPKRLSEGVQKNKKGKKGKKKPKQGEMNQKKEINSALSVLDAMLDPSEKIPGRNGGKPKTVSLDDPEDLDSDKKRTLSMVGSASVGDVENGKKLKKGKKRRQPTEESVDVSSAQAPMPAALVRSVGESVGNDHGMLTWYQGGDEESDDEAKPKEENAKAVSVMEKVLAQEDKFDDISDEELAEKKTGRGKGRKLFIANLPWKVDAETVQADFEKYGEIDSFSMPTNKQTGKPMGICFIVYSNTEGVEKALLQNDSTYNGRKIRVNIADPDAKGKAKGKGQGDEGPDAKDDPKGKGNGKGKEIGWNSKGKDKGKGKGKDKGFGKEGDWNCPSCGDQQFGRNLVCRKCGGPKSGGADSGKGKDKGKDKGNGKDKGKGKGQEKSN